MNAIRKPRLVLIGAVGVMAGTVLISGCEQSVDAKRASYTSKADCEQDWGRPEDCTQDGTPSSSDSTGALWYGPYYTRSGVIYHNDGSSTTRRVSPTRAVAVSSEIVSENELSHGHSRISRGGFGESAHGGHVGGHGG